MELVIAWLVGAIIVGLVFGTARTCGFLTSFLVSILLSPVIGFIATIMSPTKEEDAAKKQALQMQAEQLRLLRKIAGEPDPVEKPTSQIPVPTA